MPIYTYACQSCSTTLERRQSFHDEPLTTHDECGGSLRRVIHPAGIVFKGSGFYNTDYKNGTSNGSRASETASADAAKPSGESGANGTATNGTATNGTAGSASSSTSSAPAPKAEAAATP